MTNAIGGLNVYQKGIQLKFTQSMAAARSMIVIELVSSHNYTLIFQSWL